MSIKQRRLMVEKQHPELSIRDQCALLDLAASSYYSRPQPMSPLDRELMRLIDCCYLEHPYYGVERMTWVLRQAGHLVNEKRVRRLMRLMCLEAIYPKPKTSIPGGAARRFSYLLKGLKIERPDHVWASDITYIPLARGFCFLCAVMDWSTRYIVSWELSTTADGLLCLDALQQALNTGRTPEIFNTDQGAQFTSADFIDRLLAALIKPSWDGRGRWIDNVFIERFWRTVKYECVYLFSWATPAEARKALANSINLYNWKRPHSSLDKQPPAAVYFGAQYK